MKLIILIDTNNVMQIRKEICVEKRGVHCVSDKKCIALRLVFLNIIYSATCNNNDIILAVYVIKYSYTYLFYGCVSASDPG